MWRATIQVGSQTQMPGKLDRKQSVYCAQWQNFPKCVPHVCDHPEFTGQEGLVGCLLAPWLENHWETSWWSPHLPPRR